MAGTKKVVFFCCIEKGSVGCLISVCSNLTVMYFLVLMIAENVGLLLVILWSGWSSSILRHGAGGAGPQERDVRGDGLGERGAFCTFPLVRPKCQKADGMA